MFLCEPEYGNRLGLPGAGEWYTYEAVTVRSLLQSAGVTKEHAYKLWEDGPKEVHFFIQEHPKMVFSEWLVSYVAPQFTVFNWVGRVFSFGTDCTCCLGWRVALAFGLWPVVFYLGTLYA